MIDCSRRCSDRRETNDCAKRRNARRERVADFDHEEFGNGSMIPVFSAAESTKTRSSSRSSVRCSISLRTRQRAAASPPTDRISPASSFKIQANMDKPASRTPGVHGVNLGRVRERDLVGHTRGSGASVRMTRPHRCGPRARDDRARVSGEVIGSSTPDSSASATRFHPARR